ncbi:DciA family protein [Streptomyces scabiei]|uniref:DciA family protein n=3 Tax=Streptomyces scabiei TaxID=1930 RepID=UPI000765C497|nr:DciA family protein [Streptomyces scabiei]MDX2658324.1 DciA family protein [Streptomyces scabiei]MDX2999536.1 DciA family protein [Streptomyces scabiei]MDX3175290.1 DciA family protein [Streptomyces scabiei]
MTQQASGADLARQALAAYKASARTAPTTKPTRPKRKRAERGAGRDPQGLGAVLGRLTAEQGWTGGMNGGSILDQWAQLCPQYVGLVQPAHYDDTTGRLDLRPGSHTYAAQLRLLGGQLAKQINDKIGRPVVRTIRVLPVGTLDSTPRTETPTTPGPEAPVKTRETAHPGYRATLDAALAHKPDRAPTDPYLLQAIQQQDQALRAKRLPEDEHTEYLAERERLERLAGPAPGSVEASRAAALAYKRREAAGQTPRRAFDAA